MKNQFEKICMTFIVILFIAISFYASQAEARSGCCSWHGGVCGCRCCDGSSLSAKCAPYYPSCSYTPSPTPTLPKKYDCSKYGTFAYSDGLGYCKCMNGYVWGTNILGDKTCVSGNQECHNQFGYGSTYDSLSGKCKCSYGYIWGTDILGEDECVSESQYCRDKYGLNSRYNSLTDKCECTSGYELTIKTYGSGLECKSCFSKYGLHSSYDYLSKKCECDNGYTLNDNNQCVKKQNNVYFTLKELDTNKKKAVIKSAYNYQHYLITYGYGCHSFSIKRYVDNKIVVNLGTDFDLDMFDKIILYDDDETCDILSVKKVSSSFSLTPEEDVYIPYNLPIVKGVTNIIPEGALIKATNGIDIYIVKYVGTKKFKRLILSPSVFNNYGHLRWEDVMDVSQAVLDEFTTSELVRAVGDDKTYRLYAQGDTGQKRMIKNNSVLTRLGLDPDSIYEINSFDRESYVKGFDLE